MILKIFLKLKQMFQKNEPRYLLNTLFIDDFCVFIQTLDDKIIENYIKELENIKITKKDLIFNLESLEQKAVEILANDFDETL